MLTSILKPELGAKTITSITNGLHVFGPLIWTTFNALAGFGGWVPGLLVLIVSPIIELAAERRIRIPSNQDGAASPYSCFKHAKSLFRHRTKDHAAAGPREWA